MRFTAKDGILLGQPESSTVTIEIGDGAQHAKVLVVGEDQAPRSSYADGKLTVTFATPLPVAPAHAISIEFG